MKTIVKLKAIHWLFLEMKRYWSDGRHTVTMLQASNTTFFISDSILVRCTASPKHPQSFTGSATTSHRVTSVMQPIKSKDKRAVRRRRMAQSNRTPMTNSTADSRMLAQSVIQSGTRPDSPTATR